MTPYDHEPDHLPGEANNGAFLIWGAIGTFVFWGALAWVVM